MKVFNNFGLKSDRTKYLFIFSEQKYSEAKYTTNKFLDLIHFTFKYVMHLNTAIWHYTNQFQNALIYFKYLIYLVRCQFF